MTSAIPWGVAQAFDEMSFLDVAFDEIDETLGAPQDCDASSGGVCNQCPNSDTTCRAQPPGTTT